MARDSARITRQPLNAVGNPSTDSALLPASIIHLIQVHIKVGHIQFIKIVVIFATILGEEWKGRFVQSFCSALS